MAMQITKFTPMAGPPGTRVTIDLAEMPELGENLATTVILSGNRLDQVDDLVLRGSESSITVTIGKYSQSGDFTVLTGTPSQVAQSAGIFTVEQPDDVPALMDMMPRRGSAGTTVRLHGRHLDSIQYVTIGPANVYVLTTHTPTSICFEVPHYLLRGMHRVYGFGRLQGRIYCPFVFDHAG